MKKINVFCIPYAGGNAISIYSKWSKKLDSRFNLIPLDISGHGNRMNESFPKSIKEIAEDFYNKIYSEIKQKEYIIYGHSMGTIITYELLKIIKRNNLRSPKAIFISGRYSPNNVYDAERVCNLSDEMFLNKIVEIGGISKEFLQYPELIKIFLPILRNDYYIIEKYDWWQKIEKLDSDIIYLYSYEDNYVKDIEKVKEWGEYTTEKFSIFKYKGNHFFINEKWEEICKLINEYIIY